MSRTCSPLNWSLVASMTPCAATSSKTPLSQPVRKSPDNRMLAIWTKDFITVAIDGWGKLL